jgi:hypothetical protein
MSLMLGSLFYDTGLTQFPERIALILFALTFVAFGNMSELPIAVEAKRVLYKQADAGMFPVTAYVMGVILCHFPLLLAETTIFTIILYFVRVPPPLLYCFRLPPDRTSRLTVSVFVCDQLTSFTTNASAFFIFWIIMICSGLAMSVFFRMLAYVSPNEEIAQALAGPSTGIFMLFVRTTNRPPTPPPPSTQLSVDTDCVRLSLCVRRAATSSLTVLCRSS